MSERAKLVFRRGPSIAHDLRTIWVRQSEKEVNAEERFLGLPETDWNEPEMSIDDLMAELAA